MRRTVTVTIPGVKSDKPGERDNGKVFEITEMPSFQAERWCAKAKALGAQAYSIPVPSGDSGEAAALANMGIDPAKMGLALTDPSLDEIWQYVKYRHKPGNPPLDITFDENSMIEEIDTIMFLRMEALKVQLGFSGGGNRPSSESSPNTTG